MRRRARRCASGCSPASRRRTLAEAWSATPISYAIGGSPVHYADAVHGRAALRGMLAESTAAGLLACLGVSESPLLEGWRSFAAA